jgi:hypothetical protein
MANGSFTHARVVDVGDGGRRQGLGCGTTPWLNSAGEALRRGPTRMD